LAELERWLTRVGLSAHYVPSSEPASAEVLAEIDARGPFVSPAFRAQGGLVPEALKAFIPLEVSEGYAVSGCWSADRRWLLAYVYNVTHHLDRQGTHDLSQRYHRAPEPARVRFRLQHFPPGGFQCQCFDLNLRQQIRQGSFTGSTQWNQRATDHDFFVLVRPR
jgi:hypothetical protein